MSNLEGGQSRPWRSPCAPEGKARPVATDCQRSQFSPHIGSGGRIHETHTVNKGGRRRQLRRKSHASWQLLVPRQATTGGKPRLLGITKRGNTYLRTLLIHGARAAMP